MPALPSCLLEPARDQFRVLLPDRAECGPGQPGTGRTGRRNLTETTARGPSTGRSATARPWKPRTRPVGCPHTGHGAGPSRVRADTRTTSPPSATPSTTRVETPKTPHSQAR